jgi:hypothetical protein
MDLIGSTGFIQFIYTPNLTELSSAGVMSDAFGKWIGGFANVYIAKFCGAYEGLLLIENRGFTNEELQMDSSMIVRNLNRKSVGSIFLNS